MRLAATVAASSTPRRRSPRIRGGETRRAAENLAGAEYGGRSSFSDAEVNAADRDQQRAVVDVIREARPDLILTHSQGDYSGRPQRDYDSSSTAVSTPLCPSTQNCKPQPDRRSLPSTSSRRSSDTGFQLSEFVDISATFDTKVGMLRAHESQPTWLKRPQRWSTSSSR